MITGNKGEWSEIYAFFKLLADGKLHVGDADLKKIEDIYYPILMILRTESGKNWHYVRNGNIRLVDGSSGEVLHTIPINEFAQNAELLLTHIKSGKGAFAVPEIEEFMKTINCKTLKASSKDKADIALVVHDQKTGFQPTFGFSIKSRLGTAPTLFNASKATNFIFKVNGLLDDETINAINSIEKRGKIRLRVNKAEGITGPLQYCGTQDETFRLNLEVIDSKLPLIVSRIILNYYRGKASDLYRLTKLVAKENPCNYVMKSGHPFYEYKIKALLTDMALGMTATSVWNGLYDATGGYIVVREDGEVLCYHVYDRNEFQDYLLKNTKLETPGSKKHEFGKLYRDKDGLLMKLCLQIRFEA